MSDKKHIDRIFQEKLKDLEVTPNAKVWENIQGKIEHPREDTKKILPLWMRIASVAALLLVLLTVGNLFNSNKNNTTKTNNVVETENVINASEIEKNSKDANNQNLENINNITAEENNTIPKDEETIVENVSEESSTNLNNSVASSNISNTTITNDNSGSNSLQKNKSNVTPNKQRPFVITNNNNSSESESEKIAVNKIQSVNQPNVIVSNKNESNNNDTNIINSKANSERLAQNNTKNNNAITHNVATLDKNKVDSELKNSKTDALTENTINTEEENITIDAETKKEETSIEEEIAKAEDLIEKEKEEKVNRWQVYANVAPVYYNTLGKGSHIDAQFNENSKSGETNMSYGVNVSYAFNEKLKLRSGINSLNLSYDTDNVIIYENVSGNNAPLLKNIDFNNNQAISAISATNLGVQQAVGLLPNENAAISQRLGYYEVPMELEYTVSNKKFGVNVIAGLSTFILNDNKIYSEFEGRNTEIGEANNIKDVSFSGNVGLGLDYKFSDKIKLNVQPTFKYQINAYENTSGDFRPYIVGIYTGLSYKF